MPPKSTLGGEGAGCLVLLLSFWESEHLGTWPPHFPCISAPRMASGFSKQGSPHSGSSLRSGASLSSHPPPHGTQVLGKYLLHDKGQSSGHDWFPVSDASGTELKGCVNPEQALASAPLLCLLLPWGGGGRHTPNYGEGKVALNQDKNWTSRLRAIAVPLLRSLGHGHSSPK